MRKREDWPAQRFASLITEVLHRTGATQRQLADLASVDPSQIGRWKTGAARPGYDLIRQFGTALERHFPRIGIGAHDLLAAAGYGDSPPETPEQPGSSYDYPPQLYGTVERRFWDAGTDVGMSEERRWQIIRWIRFLDAEDQREIERDAENAEDQGENEQDANNAGNQRENRSNANNA